MDAWLCLWLPVTCVLGRHRCRWGCRRLSHTHTGGSGSRAQSDGWSYHIPPERQQNKTQTAQDNENAVDKGRCLIYSALLMVNNSSVCLKNITSITSSAGWLLFGSAVPLSVSGWLWLPIGPHSHRENVSKHHLSVWLKPRKAAPLRC